SAGVPVPKMSGRGLGHTGGTIDKLEAIPGFHVEISIDEFINLVNRNKTAVVGQTGNLTPADKKLYSLRDVTATVNSIPLISSSIMSKKIASGADSIVLDVKTGAGAFMKELDDARELAKAMVSIGNRVGRNTMAVISDMSQPLGKAVGNALEVREAIETLQGNGPGDLTELCLELGSHMVVLANKADTLDEARKQLTDNLNSGKAIEQFRVFLEAQGGDSHVADNPDLLPQASYTVDLPAEKSGTVSEIEADAIGTAAMMRGAGRATKDSDIDLSVGIVFKKKIGDAVSKGESLLTSNANTKYADNVKEKVYANIVISDETVEKPPLIYENITN